MIRVAGAATTAVVLLGAVASTLLLLSEGAASAQATSTPVAWYLPLLAGACVACLAWAILSGEDVGTDSDVGRGVDSCCAVCGGAIHSRWRMCPHCGERFHTDAAA